MALGNAAFLPVAPSTLDVWSYVGYSHSSDGEESAIILALVSMVLWGSWANTLLLARTRFELYFMDYALGHLLAGCLMIGNAQPSLAMAASTGWPGAAVFMTCCLAGVIFAIASFLAVVSIELAGMALATVILLGIEMSIGVPFLLVMEGWGTSRHVCLSLAGVAAVLGAVALDTACHWQLERDQASDQREADRRSTSGSPSHVSSAISNSFVHFSSLSFWSFRAASVASRSIILETSASEDIAHPIGSAGLSSEQPVDQNSHGACSVAKDRPRGLLLAACGGVFFAIWPCASSLVEGQSRWGEVFGPVAKLNPEGFFLVYAAGAYITVLMFLPPLCSRAPIHTSQPFAFWPAYLRLRPWTHFLGLLGGFAHGGGSLLSLKAGHVLGNAVAISVTRCQPLVCATWGVLLWDELKGARRQAVSSFVCMMVMFLVAVVCFLLAGLQNH